MWTQFLHGIYLRGSLQSVLLQIHQSRKLRVPPEGDHEEENLMLCLGPLVQFLQLQIYLKTFASYSRNLDVHVVLNVLF